MGKVNGNWNHAYCRSITPTLNFPLALNLALSLAVDHWWCSFYSKHIYCDSRTSPDISIANCCLDTGNIIFDLGICKTHASAEYTCWFMAHLCFDNTPAAQSASKDRQLLSWFTMFQCRTFTCCLYSNKVVVSDYLRMFSLYFISFRLGEWFCFGGKWIAPYSVQGKLHWTGEEFCPEQIYTANLKYCHCQSLMIVILTHIVCVCVPAFSCSI